MWAGCWADSAGADVVEAILDGRQPPEITLAVLMRPFAVAWTQQRKILIGCLPRSLACLDAVAGMADFVGSFDQE
jgi:hypothetical protein